MGKLSKRQIFKVQLPLVTNEPEPMALVYNRNKSFYTNVPITDDLLLQMQGQFKLFFYGTHDDTDVNLDAIAPWQEW